MIRIASVALCLVAGLASGDAYAQSNPIKDLLSGGGSNEQQFLKPDQAFVFAAEPRADGTVDLRWEIADEYYLYRDKVKVTTSAPGVQLGAPALPPGKSKYDEYFGDQIVYYGELIANVPVLNTAGLAEIPIEVTYQGCADAGLCYPPIRKSAVVRIASADGATGAARCRRPGGHPARYAPRHPPPRSPSRTPSPTASAPATCSRSSRPSSAPGSCSRSRPACCRWCRSCRASSSAPAAARRSRVAARSRSRSPTCSAWR